MKKHHRYHMKPLWLWLNILKAYQAGDKKHSYRFDTNWLNHKFYLTVYTDENN